MKLGIVETQDPPIYDCHEALLPSGCYRGRVRGFLNTTFLKVGDHLVFLEPEHVASVSAVKSTGDTVCCKKVEITLGVKYV